MIARKQHEAGPLVLEVATQIESLAIVSAGQSALCGYSMGPRSGGRSVREVSVSLKLWLTLFVRADLHWKLNWQIFPQGSCNFGLTDSLANADGLKAFASTAVTEDSTLWLKDAANAAGWRL